MVYEHLGMHQSLVRRNIDIENEFDFTGMIVLPWTSSDQNFVDTQFCNSGKGYVSFKANISKFVGTISAELISSIWPITVG